MSAAPPGGNGTVFRAPWEAQAFAITVHLHQQGLFTWPEWARALAAQIAAAGDADLGDDYYKHWVTALESLVAAKGAASPAELGACRRTWQDALESTVHGPHPLGGA